MFRGEFVDLNGGADFYGTNIEELRNEGRISLRVFLDMCTEKGIEPVKNFSGKFNLRVPAELHAEIAAQAVANGQSLNSWIVDQLGKLIEKQV